MAIPDDPDYIPRPSPEPSPTEELPRPVEAEIPQPPPAKDPNPTAEAGEGFEEAFKQLAPGEMETLIAQALSRKLGRPISGNLIRLDFDYQQGAVVTIALKEPVTVDFSF